VEQLGRELDAAGRVSLTNGWSAVITQSGTGWTAKAPSWATSLAPGASASFGFQATGASGTGPSGVACS
jgi:hypothetical protein